MTAPSTSATPRSGPATIEEAERAWLAAQTAPDLEERLRALMHPDCIVVHAAVGHQHGVDTFLRYAAQRGHTGQVKTYDETVRHFGATAVVSCLQEMQVAFVPELAPFVIQAAVTRVWVAADEGGWKLAHMQMARRLPPG
ncbi:MULTISPECIES: nuclear transport factor 2 family protein [unclassified Streptomyces]|uniref:nuclear transport factor 2 family protein n=1 Tax=unclassified Streptomyces TaxID=2593676 RepID=UPI00225490FC|nr:MULTISPECIES: nuclear transport factor 2 family protein [unclassified Streptomyces]MCX4641958.1 nuclear transport factor 2 family protein [Streptomyces sp. NBC_01446]MCX5085693.1 nuclear transport factor 2 family protein [Streptomyces sp. NBC_00401]MCX5326832.1 nuclear transport factor 2 family protein [Streptomyces sp. NBC_00120]